MSSIPATSGIYRITCTVTGKFYIGSATNLRKRWKDHCYCLNAEKHINSKLQHAWNKYGKDAFAFEVLEYILVPEMLTAREQYYFDTLKPFGKRGFNIAPTAGSSLGMKMSPKSVEKTRRANLGNTHRLGLKATPETIEKLSASHLGHTPSETTRQNLSKALKGRQFTAEHRERIRLAKLGHEVSPESRIKISVSKTGHVYSPEVYAGRMKTIVVILPDGTEQIIHGIKRFCREHHLDCSSLMRVAQGKYDQHKGYKAYFPLTID